MCRLLSIVILNRLIPEGLRDAKDKVTSRWSKNHQKNKKHHSDWDYQRELWSLLWCGRSLPKRVFASAGCIRTRSSLRTGNQTQVATPTDQLGGNDRNFDHRHIWSALRQITQIHSEQGSKKGGTFQKQPFPSFSSNRKIAPQAPRSMELPSRSSLSDCVQIYRPESCWVSLYWPPSFHLQLWSVQVTPSPIT